MTANLTQMPRNLNTYVHYIILLYRYSKMLLENRGVRVKKVLVYISKQAFISLSPLTSMTTL